MKKQIIKFWSKIYSFLLYQNKKECRYLLVDTWTATQGNSGVREGYYQSYIFETKQRMEEFIEDAIPKNRKELLLKYELIS